MTNGVSRERAPHSDRDKKLHELITLEYKYLTDQFIKNEEMGEKRVALFVSLTAGLGAAAVLVRENFGDNSPVSFPEMFIAITFAWFLFGYLTFLRIVHRNATTDKYKKQLRKLRSWFVREEDSDGRLLIPYDPFGPPDTERTGLTFRGGSGGKGGYAELVGLINLVIAGALAWQLVYYVLGVVGMSPSHVPPSYISLIALGAALVVARLAWMWQSQHANHIYRTRGAKSSD